MSVQSAKISCSSSGANQIVAGKSGYAVRVVGYVLSFSGSVNAKWQDGSTDVSGLLYGAAQVNVTAPVVGDNGRGWFQTSAGADLNLNLSGGTAVGGHVLYELVPLS